MPSVWPPPVNLPSQTRWMNTKDWFHTRKKYTVPLVLLAMLLVMASPIFSASSKGMSPKRK